VLLAVIFRSFPFFAFFFFFTVFLTTELHFPLGAAAAALSLFGLGPFFSPLAGMIADRLNQKAFQIVCLVVMAVAGFLILNIATAPWDHDVLSFIEGLAGGFAYVNGYSLAQRNVKTLPTDASRDHYAAATFPPPSPAI
jgi:predicted MFS family arabinose efflux permease